MCNRDQERGIDLPVSIKHAFVRLLTEFHTAADSYADLQLLIVGAKPDALDKLEGPPAHMWRGQHQVVWDREVEVEDWTYRFLLFGGDAGVRRFEQLLTAADGLLAKLAKSVGTWPFNDSDRSLGWLGLVEHFARFGPNLLLQAERWTWDGDRRDWVDQKNQVITLRSGSKIVRPIFDYQARWFFCPIEPSVFSASEYVIDLLLGEDAPTQLITASIRGATAPSSSKGKGKLKHKRRPRPLTAHQLKCWTAYMEHGSFQKAADFLGISREAVRKATRLAEQRIPSTSRSVMAKQKLPEDQRGQTYLPDDD